VWLLEQVKNLAAQLGVWPPLTFVVAGIGSPFIWGLGRPKLLWPVSLLGRLTQDSRRSVIVHELAHLRRRDHWTAWLQMAAECIWWWNPLFWYVRRQLRLNAELACDAWVVATLPEYRRAYAEALIEVTQLVSQSLAPAPALGMSSGARQAFERRLIMIMRDCVPCKVPVYGLLVIGLLGLAALPGWSQVAPPKPAEVRKQETTPPQEASLVLTEELLPQFMEEHVGLILGQAPAGGDPDRDRKLQEMEKKIQTLLKEVQALRSGGHQPVIVRGISNIASPAATPQTRYHVTTRLADVKEQAKPTAEAKRPVKVTARVVVTPEVPYTKVLAEIAAVRDGQTFVNLINLTRATYKLPNGKAKALADFLEQHCKVQFLETKVENNDLIVTTTLETQKTISQFIALLQGLQATSSSGGAVKLDAVEVVPVPIQRLRVPVRVRENDPVIDPVHRMELQWEEVVHPKKKELEVKNLRLDVGRDLKLDKPAVEGKAKRVIQEIRIEADNDVILRKDKPLTEPKKKDPERR
jgi:hypothetical protein